MITLRSRYPNMYIPSDCFNAVFSWTDAFRLNEPFRMGTACAFHVMPKDVEPLQPNDAVLDPPDADHLFTAKVHLLLSILVYDLYKIDISGSGLVNQNNNRELGSCSLTAARLSLLHYRV